MNDVKLTPSPVWLILLVSYLIPPVGIILGVMYRGKEAPESKRFGSQAITVAILGLVTCAVLYAVWFVVLGAAGLLR